MAERGHRSDHYGPKDAKSPIRDGWVAEPVQLFQSPTRPLADEDATLGDSSRRDSAMLVMGDFELDLDGAPPLDLEVGAGSIPVGAGNITEETAIKTGQQPADQHGELSTLQWLDEVARGESLGRDVPRLEQSPWPPPPPARDARPPSALVSARPTASAPQATCDLPTGVRMKKKSKIRRPNRPAVLGELI